MRCILCKGSYYPPTTPRPVIVEVPLSIPLCELECDKSEKECKLWNIGNNPLNETETLLTLIAVSNSQIMFIYFYIYIYIPLRIEYIVLITFIYVI